MVPWDYNNTLSDKSNAAKHNRAFHNSLLRQILLEDFLKLLFSIHLPLSYHHQEVRQDIRLVFVLLIADCRMFNFTFNQC